MTTLILTPPANNLAEITRDALLLVQSLGLELDDGIEKKLNKQPLQQWQETILKIPTVLRCDGGTCGWSA
jgi:hypothetical protein